MSKYRIISFDGGGLRGLLSLGMMERISQKLGSDSWIEQADIFAGTSTGGLIALGLAAGKSVEEIKSFYEMNGPSIFDRNTFLYISSIFRTFHIGYENKDLEEALGLMFGDKKLTDIEKDVLVVSFDLKEKIGKRASWAPKIFHNIKGEGQDADLAREVGLYTSAAPTYLPSVEGYIDGGVCANNPSMCAIAQLLDTRTENRKDVSEIYMLSIGTGVEPKSIGQKNIRWGIFGWNVKILQIIMDGSVGIADYQCKHLLSKERYNRFQLDLDDNIGMDDASKIEEMESIANSIKGSTIEAWADWINVRW